VAWVFWEFIGEREVLARFSLLFFGKQATANKRLPCKEHVVYLFSM
jgi:hypothetical protein